MSCKTKSPDIPSSFADVPPVETQSWAAYLGSIANFRGNIDSLTAPSFIISGTSLTEYSAYWVYKMHERMLMTGGTSPVVQTDTRGYDS
jgi:hypothetical protein